MYRWVLLVCLAGCDDGASESVRLDARVAPADAERAGDGGESAADTAIDDATVDSALVADAVVDSALADAGRVDAAFGDDLNLAAEDFDCMLEWTPVRRFYVTNKLGRMDETLAVANNPAGGSYPPGTVIQLVPQEAMVKRAPGWSPATNDWEFFFLDIDREGTVSIRTRGAEETQNAFGGNCFDCHAKAAPQWDLVCEQDHGCDPLPFGEAVIRNLQNADARCP